MKQNNNKEYTAHNDVLIWLWVLFCHYGLFLNAVRVKLAIIDTAAGGNIFCTHCVYLCVEYIPDDTKNK